MAPRRYKRRTNRKKKQSSKPRTKVDKKLSRRITKLENAVEVKYSDYATDDVPVNSGLAKSICSTIDDGTDYNERVGNQIISKKVYLQYRAYYPNDPMTGGPGTQLRVIMFWDKQFNSNYNFQIFTGVSPTSLELSASLLDNRAGMVSMNAPYNQNTRERYHILYDRVHNINFTSPKGQVLNVKKMIALHGAKIQYSDASVGVDSLPSRNLVIVYFDSLGLDPIQFNLTTRYFFTDM